MPLTTEIDALSSWIARLPRAGMDTLGGDGAPMREVDFVMIGAIKRSLSLATGLRAMVEAKNIVCSRAMLRMQLDTVARLLAYTYVQDPEALAHGVLKGKQLKKFKSREGAPLIDLYLVNRMSESYPWVRKVYEFTSGYVHFSERQFFDSISSVGARGNMTIQLQVSSVDDNYPESSWEEVVACFNHLLAILESILSSYTVCAKKSGPA